MSGRLKTPALALLLLALNVYICRELFATEWLRHMGSIEGAYIAISRYAMENWGDLGWFPLWYGGVPYQNTYPPLLHWIVAIVAGAARMSPALAHHATTAFFYCAGPLTLFWLALRFSGSRAAAFAAGVLYSVLSPSAWLIPAIAHDLGSPLHPRRLQALVYFGEGPHVSAMTLLPVAMVCLDLALTERRPQYYLLAALSLAAVVLTNWLAAFSLAILAISYLLARLGTKGWDLKLLARAGALGVAAYLLAAPWIPPSTIRTIQFNARTIGGNYIDTYHALPKFALLGLLAVIFLKLLFRKWRVGFATQFTLLFLFFTAALTLAFAWGEVAIVPQPMRYHLEMEMALCLAAGQAFLPVRSRRIGIAAFAVAALLLVQPIRQCRRYARDYLISRIDIRSTTEYRTARWFDQHLGGRRVMAPGSTSFWMNVFTDTPQIGGGFDQGTTNWMNRVAIYVIYSGEATGTRDAEISLLWLKAMGVYAVAVSGPTSSELYKPFRNPKKFDGVLKELWRSGDDVIYEVPQRFASLARIIGRGHIVARPPLNGIDVDPILRYVAALDDPSLPPAEMRWTSRHSARITGDLRDDHLISVQATWHPGWHATVNGEPRPIRPDGLGQIIIEPRCRGACLVDLVYDGGAEMRLARWAAAAALIILGMGSLRAMLRRT